MSQIYKSIAGGGPLPPAIPTSFVTDINSPSVPIANVENVLGGFVSTNNNKGIQTDGSSGSNTLTIQLTNRFNNQTTTVGAGSSTVTILSALAAGTYVFDIMIAAYATVGGPAAEGYTIVGAVTSTGAAATLLPNQQKDSFEQNVGCNALLGVSGNTATITVNGVAGINFDWNITGEYITVS